MSCYSSSSSSSSSSGSKKERCMISMGSLAPFLISSLALSTIFSYFYLYSQYPLKIMPKNVHDHNQKLHRYNEKNIESCDLFKGRWVPDSKGSQYTNWSCSTIPISKNCFRHGRKDTEFLNWRWKPDNCELPRFDAKAFLTILRGKKLAFIGDSVARNHLDSLLCLLSQEEIPMNAYKDSEDQNPIWHFADHNFTLSMLWSKFLTVGDERFINGSSSGIYDLHLHKFDKWTAHLPNTDFAIMSTAHWFFRPIHIHNEHAKIIGCVYCSEPNVTALDPVAAIGLTLRAALRYINKCEQCNKKMVTLLRTFSPAHFEKGTWNTGGSCNRTAPYREKGGFDSEDYRWRLRNVQVEEVERARKEAVGKKEFRVLDVTMAMLMRPDGHPGAFWGNKWMKGFNDCVHWCLPGPIDLWSDFLMQVLTKGVAG